MHRPISWQMFAGMARVDRVVWSVYPKRNRSVKQGETT
jgi:hypothetical protein